MAISSLLPTPDDAFGHFQTISFPSINDFHEATIRTDYNLSDRHRISARAFLNYFNQPATSIDLLSTDRSWKVNWQSYAGNYTWTISPSIVNNINLSYSRMFDQSNSGLTGPDGKGICYSQFINVADPSTTPCSIEELGVGGGYDAGGFGLGQNFNGINRSTWGASESISISKGKHLIVAGVDVLRQYWYENTDWLALPIIDFNGGKNGQFTGSGMADFLLGLPVHSLRVAANPMKFMPGWLPRTSQTKSS